MILEFEHYQIDTKELKLTLLGRRVEVEPAVLKVLVFLIENRHKVVTRDSIFSQVWSDRFVSDSALTNHIKNARKALGDDGNTQAMIKTIHGRGYQFVCSAKEISCHKIAVLPIHSSSPEHSSKTANQIDYLGVALASHLVAELSRFSQLNIHSGKFGVDEFCSRNDSIASAENHNVDYLLTGNYLEHQGTTRLFIELVDIKKQLIIWSELLEITRSSIFVMQDFVSSVVCEALTRQLKLTLNDNSKDDRNKIQNSNQKRVTLTLV